MKTTYSFTMKSLKKEEIITWNLLIFIKRIGICYVHCFILREEVFERNKYRNLYERKYSLVSCRHPPSYTSKDLSSYPPPSYECFLFHIIFRDDYTKIYSFQDHGSTLLLLHNICFSDTNGMRLNIFTNNKSEDDEEYYLLKKHCIQNDNSSHSPSFCIHLERPQGRQLHPWHSFLRSTTPRIPHSWPLYLDSGPSPWWKHCSSVRRNQWCLWFYNETISLSRSMLFMSSLIPQVHSIYTLRTCYGNEWRDNYMNIIKSFLYRDGAPTHQPNNSISIPTLYCQQDLKALVRDPRKPFCFRRVVCAEFIRFHFVGHSGRHVSWRLGWYLFISSLFQLHPGRSLQAVPSSTLLHLQTEEELLGCLAHDERGQNGTELSKNHHQSSGHPQPPGGPLRILPLLFLMSRRTTTTRSPPLSPSPSPRRSNWSSIRISSSLLREVVSRISSTCSLDLLCSLCSLTTPCWSGSTGFLSSRISLIILCTRSTKRFPSARRSPTIWTECLGLLSASTRCSQTTSRTSKSTSTLSSLLLKLQLITWRFTNITISYLSYTVFYVVMYSFM